MTVHTPLSCYLPLKVKLILVGCAGVFCLIGITLAVAAVIDWLCRW